MIYLSAFQLLPPHVVKLIVDHVAGSSRLRYDDVTTDSDEYKLLEMPLLWVCHNFRAFVHQHLCKVLGLYLKNDRDRAEVDLCSWPIRKNELSYPTHHLAKELCIFLDIESVFSGKALQLLSDVPYEGCPFPQVRKLDFHLFFDNEGHYGLEPGHDTDDTLKTRLIFPPDITANITAFAQRVKQMVSAISEINVGFHKEAERLLERRNVHILDLTRLIFRVAEKHTAITRSNALLLMCLDLESIRDLVHIDCRIRARLPDLMLLIYRNTSTLQYLEISGSSEDLAGLVGDPDSDGYLEYPCLHTLKMSLHGSIEKLQLPAFKDVVPFP
ncbi:hypothetical protein GGI16_002167 [Coemansia sp. S142-1]|nr:hypothetical protein GGI16_002167 [Coemansia sp. S142-1]